MVWTLLIVFQVKHFLCDFPLQGQYMLGKFKGGTEWVLPLAAHAGVHALFTFGISLWACYCCPFWLFEYSWKIPAMLAAFDFLIHFTVDRLKASPNLGGRWKADKPQFWYALGADQMAHHLTHYLIIWILLRGG